MSLKIQLLGTAGGDFKRIDDQQDKYAYLPRVRELGGKNLRRPAQTVLFPDILIDYYDGRQLEEFGIHKESIRHLLITHAHWDHFQPIEIMRFAAALPHQLQVYGNQSVIDALKFTETYTFDRSSGKFSLRNEPVNVGYHVMQVGKTYTIDNTSVAVLHANHGIDKSNNMLMSLECLNYLIERDGKTLFYGLDSSHPLPRTVESLQGYRLDLAIFDATFGQWPIDAVKSGHQNLIMLIETAEEFRAAGLIDEESILLASHIALAEVKPYDDLVGEFMEYGIILAYDGMIVEI